LTFLRLTERSWDADDLGVLLRNVHYLARRLGRDGKGGGESWLAMGRAGLDDDPRRPARALGYLFLAGATIGLCSLLLPLPAGADVGGLYSNVAFAFVGGLSLLCGASKIRPWMIHASLAVGSVLITRAIILSGDAVSFYSVWFIWVGLFSFSFCSRAAAAGHMIFVAVLYAGTLVNDPPSSPVARWLTTVSTLVVAGIFIGTLVRHTRRQADAAATSARSMARVTDLAHELAALSDAPAARRALCEGALRVTLARESVLWEPTSAENRLHASASAGRSPATHSHAREASSGAIQAALTAKPCVESHPPAADPHMPSGARESPGGRAWQPIMHESRVIAVLELSWSDTRFLQDPPTLAMAGLLAVEASVTLQRLELLAKLEEIAQTDELTGLRNRRAWHERIPVELARASRGNESLSVAMLDLDHFKHYNDEHGHQAGDRLLKQVASFWSNELRPTDILARYGGEEFALALPAAPLDQALKLVERFRTAIPDGQSCSAGLASWNGTETAQELLDRADRALYQAKRAGRNRSATAPDEPALRQRRVPL
jgi:diguanylate cyclase (GGDEF)-like protein